jgi:hypothetical protein
VRVVKKIREEPPPEKPRQPTSCPSPEVHPVSSHPRYRRVASEWRRFRPVPAAAATLRRHRSRW